MKEGQKPDEGELVVPVPPDAPAPPASHLRLGKPIARWTYRSLTGEVLGYISRFDLPGGGKVFLPLTLQRSVRGLRWFWKALPEPRPLYGLDQLAAHPEAPVLICEGEKAADAAQQIFPGHVAVTSHGGAAAARKADWEILRGREVLIWPDYDQSGADYAREVAEILSDMGCAVSVIDISELVEIEGGKRAADRTVDGWDAADAINEWSDLGTLRDAALGLAQPFPGRREGLSHQDARPRLKVDNGHPERTVANLRDILARSGRLYDRGTPVRVVRDQTLGSFVADELKTDSLTLEAHLVCQPYKVKDSGLERDATLPPSIARMYLSCRGDWGLRVLNGVTTAPLLSDDGSIRTAHGFDPATGLWCESVPDLASLVPENPTRDQATAALIVVREAFKTFCFADAQTV